MSYIMDLRKLVGSRTIIMASASVLILNKEGQLLLQKRKDNGYWGYPGGSMELGESFEETARREALEETGLKIKSLQLFDIISGKKSHYKYPNGDEIYDAAVIFISDDWEGELKVQESEVVEQRFFDLTQLPEGISPINMEVIQKCIILKSDRNGKQYNG